VEQERYGAALVRVMDILLVHAAGEQAKTPAPPAKEKPN